MFTPLPSPLPLLWQQVVPSRLTQMNHPIQDTPIAPSKQKFRWSTRWTVVLIPLALILLAASTRFGAHPAVFDLLSAGCDHEWTGWTNALDWSLHDPHVPLSNQLSRRSASGRLVVRNATTSIPTVPVNPVLPSPFPRPFDTALSSNFTTASCYDFFLNMTVSDPLLSCRPFSLLMYTSYAFEKAQEDIDLMNTDVWGTCNTDPSQPQCDDNMSWFAASLQTSCQKDLGDQVETAVMALNALYAYDLMRNVSCNVDPGTNAYCYLEAVANTDPSSYFFYGLALGRALGPNVTASVCNRCTMRLMASYGSALSGTGAATLEGLGQTYNGAVDTVNKLCGSSIPKAAEVSSSNWARVNAGMSRMTSLVALSVLAVLYAGVM